MTDPTTICNGRWLRLRRRGQWEYAERTNPGGAVLIIALTPDDRLLFVEQYRVAIEAVTIELPAGLVGDLPENRSESALEAAGRELFEETGWQAGSVEFLFEGPTSAGMSNEMITFVRARDLRRVGPGGGDETEQISLHEVPRAEAAEWLIAQQQAGRSVDPKIFGALYLLEHEALFVSRGAAAP